MISYFFQRPTCSTSVTKKWEIPKIFVFVEVSDQTLEDIFMTSF